MVLDLASSSHSEISGPIAGQRCAANVVDVENPSRLPTSILLDSLDVVSSFCFPPSARSRIGAKSAAVALCCQSSSSALASGTRNVSMLSKNPCWLYCTACLPASAAWSCTGPCHFSIWARLLFLRDSERNSPGEGSPQLGMGNSVADLGQMGKLDQEYQIWRSRVLLHTVQLTCRKTAGAHGRNLSRGHFMALPFPDSR